jgi:hypothetical protein
MDLESIVGVCALVVSIIAICTALWASDRDHKRILREQMNSLVSQMIYVNGENNTQLAVFVSVQAVGLIKQAPTIMTSLDYVTTAETLFTAQNWADARHYWEIGIEKAENDSEHTRVAVRRGYAERLYYSGDSEKGRELYREASRLVPNDRDLYRFLNAHTYSMWYFSESYYVLNGESSEDHYRQAKNLYESLSDRATRQRGLQELERKREMLQQYRSEQGY